MQNDLISRSVVEKMMHDYFINCVENGKYEVDVTEVNTELQETLSELPIAYDVEKVVQQLDDVLYDRCYNYEYKMAFKEMEKIVRNGGKE